MWFYYIMGTKYSNLNPSIYENTKNKEAELWINQINYNRDNSNGTTLTDYDIDLLHNFSKYGFNTNYSEIEFKNIPLKNLFPGLHYNKLNINELMSMSKIYNDAMNKQKTIENFNGTSPDNSGTILCSRLSFILFCIIVFLLVFYGIIALLDKYNIETGFNKQILQFNIKK